MELGQLGDDLSFRLLGHEALPTASIMTSKPFFIYDLPSGRPLVGYRGSGTDSVVADVGKPKNEPRHVRA